jgi:hypothetical protein
MAGADAGAVVAVEVLVEEEEVAPVRILLELADPAVHRPAAVLVAQEDPAARMIRALTGIQIGPRQLELPPNMPVSDSAGR